MVQILQKMQFFIITLIFGLMNLVGHMEWRYEQTGTQKVHHEVKQ